MDSVEFAIEESQKFFLYPAWQDGDAWIAWAEIFTGSGQKKRIDRSDGPR
jgi:hypothetical protein